MSMTIQQFTFGGGQINRGLVGRRDLEKYYQGAFKIENFVVKRHGTLEKRHGMKMTLALPESENFLRLIPFTGDNDTCDYVAVSEIKFHFFNMDGEEIGTPIAFPYSGDDVAKVVLSMEYIQSGDTLFLASRSFAPRRLRRTAPETFALDEMPFEAWKTNNRPTLGVDTSEWTKADNSKDRQILYRVAEVVGGKEVMLSEAVEVTVPMPPADGSYTTITVMRNSSDEGFDGYNIYRNDGSGWGYIGTTVGTDDAAIAGGKTQAFEIGGGWAQEGSETSRTWTKNTTLSMPGSMDKWIATKVRCVALSGGDVYEVGEDNLLTCKYGEDPINLSVVATVGKSSWSGNGYIGARIRAIMDEVNGNTYESGEARLAAATSLLESDPVWDIELSGTGGEAAGEMAIEVTLGSISASVTPLPSGNTACRLTYDSQATGWNSRFVDNYIQLDYSQGIPEYRQPFEEAGDYPGVVGLYQQRMIWASTDNDPSMFWMSVPGDLGNFSVHTNIQDDDMINAALPLTRGPRILHCVSHKYLIFLCENSECLVRSANGGLTYSTIVSEQQSYTGSSERVRPLVCGNAILFVDRAGASVREYKYDYSLDAMAGRDVSVLNSEMFASRGGVVDWCYQMFPDSLVWCVFADGSLGVFCYMPEQDVYAWSSARLPEGYGALSIACGDALEDTTSGGGTTKMSSVMVLANGPDDKQVLFVLDSASFADTVLGEGAEISSVPVVGEVETVVPDNAGQMEPLRKRLVTASVRGRELDAAFVSAIDRNGASYGVPLGGDEAERNRRVEGEIAEAQLQGDWGFDSRLLIRDEGTGCTEIMNVTLSVDMSTGF